MLLICTAAVKMRARDEDEKDKKGGYSLASGLRFTYNAPLEFKRNVRQETMYAVISSGGKQYRVSVGQVIQLEKLPEEVGQGVDFKDVLMVSDGDDQHIGRPYLEGATVKGQVVKQDRAKKIKVLKFKRRKHHMKRMGHRQSYTAVKIESIEKKGVE